MTKDSYLHSKRSRRKDKNRRFYRFAVFIIAVSTILKLICVFSLPAAPIHFDGHFYHGSAQGLVQYGLYLHDGIRSSIRPPLYSFFLAGIYAIFGESLIVVRLIQIAMSLIIAFLIYILGLRLWKDSPSAAVGALIFLSYPVFIFFPSYLMTEILFIFLISGGFLLLNRMFKSSFAGLGAGILFGAAALTRSVMAGFIIVSGVYAFFKLPKTKKKGAAFLLLGAFLCIGPWTVRNYLLHGGFILINTSVARTLEHQTTERREDNNIGLLKEFNPNALHTRKLKILDENQTKTEEYIHYQRLIREIKDHVMQNPVDFLKMGVVHFVNLWGRLQHFLRLSNLDGCKYTASLLLILNSLLYIFFLSLALVGLVRSESSPLKHLIVMLIVYYSFVHFCVHGLPRYRIPMLPFLFLFTLKGFQCIMNKPEELLVLNRQNLTTAVLLSIFWISIVLSFLRIIYIV